MCNPKSRNGVPRVAQRYGTMAAHTRRLASVLVMVVLCLRAHVKFAGLIRRTPPPTFSDTAITDRHSDTTIFQLRAHWVRISGKLVRTCAAGGSRTLDSLRARRTTCPLWNFVITSLLSRVCGNFTSFRSFVITPTLGYLHHCQDFCDTSTTFISFEVNATLSRVLL